MSEVGGTTLRGPGIIGDRLDPAKLASAMLDQSSAIAARMPFGFFSNPALDLLLELYVAEAGSKVIHVRELRPAGAPSPMVTRRWIDALAAQGYLLCCESIVTLSSEGRSLMNDVLRDVSDIYRSLD